MSSIAPIEEDTKAPKVTPAEQAAALEQLRRELYGEETNKGVTVAAVFFTILFHCFLLLSLPYIVKISNEYGGVSWGMLKWTTSFDIRYDNALIFEDKEVARPSEIEESNEEDTFGKSESEELDENLAPKTLKPAIQTNPDVPQNKPDTAVYTSSRDQQAAQPEASAILGDDGVPLIVGDDPDFLGIVEGDISDIDEIAKLSPGHYQLDGEDASNLRSDEEYSLAVTEEVAPIPTAPAPHSEYLKFLSQTSLGDDGFGSYMDSLITDTVHEVTTDSPADVIDITPKNPLNTENTHNRAQTVNSPKLNVKGSPTPLPRPRILPKVVPGPLKENSRGVSRIGAIAVDADFSEYGDYTHRMREAIGIHWNNLVEESYRSYAEMRSTVVIEFYLTSTGHIEDLRVVSSTADRLRTLFCEEAIRARAPYGEWSNDMKAAFKDRQRCVFTFYYR